MRVFVMDLLCMVPYYNGSLMKALSALNMDVRLGSITFHYNKKYFAKNNVKLQRGMIDVIGRCSIRNKIIRRALKLAEYLLNLLLMRLIFTIKKPDIVHVQWLPLITRTSLEMRFLRSLKKNGAKIIYTVHNILPHDTGSKYKAFYEDIYRQMDALICHTQQTKHELVEQFGISSEKIWIIPMGAFFLDLKEISREESRKTLSLADGQVMVLFCGIIRPYKGLEFLLAAWKKVMSQCPNATLVIAGNGDAVYMESILSKIQSLALTQSVRTEFKYLTEHEFSIDHSAADILVYPYQQITQSAALLSGMAFNKPIIATTVGGIAEILKNNETALLVDYGDVEKLSENIIILINSPEKRTRMGTAVRREVALHYSWDKIARQTMHCYHDVLTSKAESACCG